MKYLRTSDIARAVGVHVNTIRFYEEIGLLPPIPRNESGYRLFDEFHLLQVRLVRAAMHITLLGGKLRKITYGALYSSAEQSFDDAAEKTAQALAMIKREQEQAELAMEFLEKWIAGELMEDPGLSKSSSEIAELLDVTFDMLRDWERNGLIEVPRNPENGYRVYGSREVNRLRLIRILRKSGYSTMAILRVLKHFDSGHREDFKTILNTPDADDGMEYHCSTDMLLPALLEAEKQAGEMLKILEEAKNFIIWNRK